MEKIVIICFSAEMGINPFVRCFEDKSEIDDYVKCIVKCVYNDYGPVYAEVYRLCEQDLLTLDHCFSYDGESLKKSFCLKPSFNYMKNFVRENSFKSLEL